MDNIQYDPEQILNGFSEDVLKELAKKLKRRIRQTKNDIIQEILSPPKGKPEARVKVWQEINWQLRKELESFSEDVSEIFSSMNVPIEERFKVGYMFTLSPTPEIRAKGEELYCQAVKNKELDNEDPVELSAEITGEILEVREVEEMTEVREVEEMTEAREVEEMTETREVAEMTETREVEEMTETREVEEMTETREVAEMTEAREVAEMTETREVEEMTETREIEEMTEAREVEEMTETREVEEMTEAREVAEMAETREVAEMIETREVAEMIEVREVAEMTEAREVAEMIETREAVEMIETREAVEMIETREVVEMIEAREVVEMIEAREVAEMIEAKKVGEPIEAREVAEMIEAKKVGEPIESREAEATLEATSRLKMLSEGLMTEETEELHKKIKTLENKLRKTIAEGLRTKEQFEKLKIDMAALRSQWVREKEETGKHRNRVRDLEGERTEKEKEIELLKQKLEQKKTLVPPKTKEQIQRKDFQKIKSEPCGEIDLASYQGRKALIFAERDNDVDIRLNALGIIPIWAMEIDWNRPRRRMSTCEIVLYKMNDKRLNKLDEIRDIARYWNIPCNELLNI